MLRGLAFAIFTSGTPPFHTSDLGISPPKHPRRYVAIMRHIGVRIVNDFVISVDPILQSKLTPR